MRVSDAGSTTSLDFAAQTTTPGRAWQLFRPGTIATSPGMNQCHYLNGSSAAGQTLTVTMHRMGASVETMSGAVCVTGRATTSIRLED
eukprot:1082366-Amphidinium_carterae.1